MPVHRVRPDGELESAIEEIESSERIVSTELVGDGCVLVFTEPRSQKRATPAAKETRA